MNQAINLPAIYIANILGLMVALMTLFGNKWHWDAGKETKILKMMLYTAAFSCIMDPLIFTCDGKPGIFSFIIVYFGNLWLFCSNLILCPLWMHLILGHVMGSVTKRDRIVMYTICGVSALILVMNFFMPIVFSVDGQNVYHRGPLFFIFTLLELLFIIYGVGVYIVGRKNGGILVFFPVGEFVIPTLIGVLIQSLIYGVSTIWPCTAISICGIVYGLQNEFIYQDALTGLYNRYYLDYIKKALENRKDSTMTAMMLDMNDFKSINDHFGHQEGDVALAAAAEIMRRVVGSLGSAIRYAGDEFMILMNTKDVDVIEGIIYTIKSEMEAWNRNSDKLYKISASIGYCTLDMKQYTVDEIMNEVDKRMYEEKKKYYNGNPRVDRRMPR